MLRESTLEVPKRRAYSAQLKAQVLQQCSQEGASVSGVALSHSLNANMVHRWIRKSASAFWSKRLKHPASSLFHSNCRMLR